MTMLTNEDQKFLDACPVGEAHSITVKVGSVEKTYTRDRRPRPMTEPHRELLIGGGGPWVPPGTGDPPPTPGTFFCEDQGETRPIPIIRPIDESPVMPVPSLPFLYGPGVPSSGGQT
jgi:hypothetical protein